MAAPQIVLYGVRQVPFTEKCRRALVLKGLAFELQEPTSPDDYQRWSPKTGLLPVMTVDGEWVSDSTAILFRLDEIQPEPPLLSEDPTIAAQQRQLEDWADESFLWYFLEWRHLQREPEPAAQRHSLLARLVRRQPPATPRALAERELLGGVEARLADLTVHAMLASLGRGTIPGAAARIANRPPLLAFMRRVEAATGG